MKELSEEREDWNRELDLYRDCFDLPYSRDFIEISSGLPMRFSPLRFSAGPTAEGTGSQESPFVAGVRYLISCPSTALFPKPPPNHPFSHVIPQWQQYNDSNERHETHEIKERALCV